MLPTVALWTIRVNSLINSGWITNTAPRPAVVSIGKITATMKRIPELSLLNNYQKIKFINMFPTAAGLPKMYKNPNDNI
jgi:hypothetical protein